MLRGSYCSGCGGRVLLRHEPKTLPAYGEDLTYRVNEVEQGKSTLLPVREGSRKATHGGVDRRKERKRTPLCNGADTG